MARKKEIPANRKLAFELIDRALSGGSFIGMSSGQIADLVFDRFPAMATKAGRNTIELAAQDYTLAMAS